MLVDDRLQRPFRPEFPVHIAEGYAVGDGQAGLGRDRLEVVDAIMPGGTHGREALDEIGGAFSPVVHMITALSM